MQGIRHLLAHRRLVVLLCALALVVKLLVPAGYMIDNSGGHIAIAICSGNGPVTMMMDMPDMHGDASGQPDRRAGGGKEHGKGELPCAFSGLAAAADRVDPIQLAALIAFVLATGVASQLLPAPSGALRLRPPLRGPPAYP